MLFAVQIMLYKLIVTKRKWQAALIGTLDLRKTKIVLFEYKVL